MVKLLKPLILFIIGGILYICIELLWRGYSHWTMFCLGGVAFVLIGSINEHFSWAMPLWKQCGIATVICTVLELLTGCIVNLWLGWDVWNYTVMDVLGQISLPFMGLWFLLSAVGIVLDDYVRWILFNEEKPRYKIF